MPLALTPTPRSAHRSPGVAAAAQSLFGALWRAALLAAMPTLAHAQVKPVYRCPGNLYTDTLSAKEAIERGCKTLEGTPITIIQSPVRREPAKPAASGAQGTTGSGASGNGSARVDPAEQRARDSDRRKILESELKREEEALATLQRDYTAGEAERRGDERNYAKYQERLAEMKAAIARKEADIAAIKREIAKLP